MQCCQSQCVSVYVCVCVCARLSVPLNLRFSIGMHLDYISDKFEGQGHRSNVKVRRIKTWFLGFGLGSPR